jgi:ATP-dependent exoDNAse (exonuclease V) alpha subunit
MLTRRVGWSQLPVVRFASGVECPIEKYTWTMNGASFRQLPLELGWALSIHKSQVWENPCSL